MRKDFYCDCGLDDRVKAAGEYIHGGLNVHECGGLMSLKHGPFMLGIDGGCLYGL